VSGDSKPSRARATDPAAARGHGQPEGMADADYLLDILSGKYRAQALSTLAALGIPDMLAEAECGAEQLAERLGGESDGLKRLLDFTVGMGFLVCGQNGKYGLGQLGKQLQTGALGRLAAFMGSPEQWSPWSNLRQSLRSKDGRSPFELTFGEDLYSYLSHAPESAQEYDLAIDAFTQLEARALCGAFDFTGKQCLVDVGGGRGMLLREVLGQHPELAGVLVDRPDVVERAGASLPAELMQRIALHGGDFFNALPQGHDLYCIKHVLHNWDDERAANLLKACAEAMQPGGHVLVIESILTPDHRLDLARVMDFEMSVLTKGRARRKPEFRALFRRAGLKLESVQAIGSSWLLVGSR
jgi:hypothetical protein